MQEKAQKIAGISTYFFFYLAPKAPPQQQKGL